MTEGLRLIPVQGIPEIAPEADLAGLISAALRTQGLGLQDRDILVVTSKAVAKAAGCVIRAEEVRSGAAAEAMARQTGKPARLCQVVLEQSREVLRTAPGVIISRTVHGFVMANAGVDESNSGGPGRYIVLPPDPDRLAQGLRRALSADWGCRLAVVISDSFGRPWRNGQIDLAVGVSGLAPLESYRGLPDDDGRPLTATAAAIADELAAAADLCAGKTRRVPAVIIRGYQFRDTEEEIGRLIMPRQQDLFGAGEPPALRRLLDRRTIREYDGSPLTEDELAAILAAGCHAPSAHDSRPWHFTVIESAEQKTALRRMLNSLLEADLRRAGFDSRAVADKVARSRRSLDTAAVYIVLAVRVRLPENRLAPGTATERLLAEQSLSLAGGQMLLAASLLGLGGCWYAAPLFCESQVAAFCGYDGAYLPRALLTIGRPAEQPRPKEPVDTEQYCTRI